VEIQERLNCCIALLSIPYKLRQTVRDEKKCGAPDLLVFAKERPFISVE
jgi:hypothetical protein